MEKQDRKISLNNTEFILVVIVSIILGVGISFIAKPSKTKYEKVDENVQNMIETYNYILNNYYKDLDNSIIANGAIEGMLNAVGDKYTVYMNESESDNFNITMNGSYGGLGIQIAKFEGIDNIYISGVFKDSPAKEAGLEVGDIIISVDGKAVKGMTTSELSKYIRNSSNEKYTLVIERDNKEKTVEVKKRLVVIQSVTSDILEKSGKKIGYIYVSIFASNTDSQFAKALNDLEAKGIDGLIIDLRSNGGGELDAANNIISLFMNNDKVIYQIEDRDGNVKKTYSKGDKDKSYKISILVNKDSASASEVLTAALKENLNATVVGENTYGKGTVQTLLTTPSGEQYKMTTKKWLTPKGNWINEVGITPDISVELKDSEDNQLRKALENIVK